MLTNIEGSPQIARIAVNPDEETDSKGEQIEGSKTEDSTMKEGTVTYDIRFMRWFRRQQKP